MTSTPVIGKSLKMSDLSADLRKALQRFSQNQQIHYKI